MDTEVKAGAAFELDNLAIDRDAEVPIGVQLAWALRSRIADGRFKPGQRLPGLRDLAEGIGVNVNTVRAVYQRLEGEGLIDSQQGVGTFVSSGRRTGFAGRGIAADAAREAEANGVDPRGGRRHPVRRARERPAGSRPGRHARSPARSARADRHVGARDRRDRGRPPRGRAARRGPQPASWPRAADGRRARASAHAARAPPVGGPDGDRRDPPRADPFRRRRRVARPSRPRQSANPARHPASPPPRKPSGYGRDLTSPTGVAGAAAAPRRAERHPDAHGPVPASAPATASFCASASTLATVALATP